MKYKIPYNKINAFTLVELVIVITAITILTVTVILNTNPGESKKKARDNKRLSDIASIERVINEYFLDIGTYPGEVNVVYSSSNLNWIPGDLSTYITTLPQDPTNKDQYYYYYTHDENSYEINTKLEYFTDLMEKDNGNVNSIYESGTNLFLMSSTSPAQ